MQDCKWCERCFLTKRSLFKHSRFCRLRPASGQTSSNTTSPRSTPDPRVDSADCEKWSVYSLDLTDPVTMSDFAAGENDLPFWPSAAATSSSPSVTWTSSSPSAQQQYACRHCTKLFSKSWNRDRHELIHTAEQPHQCMACGRRFNHPSNMRRHIRRKHE